VREDSRVSRDSGSAGRFRWSRMAGGFDALDRAARSESIRISCIVLGDAGMGAAAAHPIRSGPTDSGDACCRARILARGWR